MVTFQEYEQQVAERRKSIEEAQARLAQPLAISTPQLLKSGGIQNQLSRQKQIESIKQSYGQDIQKALKEQQQYEQEVSTTRAEIRRQELIKGAYEDAFRDAQTGYSSLRGELPADYVKAYKEAREIADKNVEAQMYAGYKSQGVKPVYAGGKLTGFESLKTGFSYSPDQVQKLNIQPISSQQSIQQPDLRKLIESKYVLTPEIRATTPLYTRQETRMYEPIQLYEKVIEKGKIPTTRLYAKEEYGAERIATPLEEKYFTEQKKPEYYATTADKSLLGRGEEYIRQQRMESIRMGEAGSPIPGILSSGISTVKFGKSLVSLPKELVTKPVSTVTSFGYGLKETGREVISGELGTKLGRVLKEEPGFAIGYLGGEIAQAGVGAVTKKVGKGIITKVGAKKIPTEEVFAKEVLRGEETFPLTTSTESALKEFRTLGKEGDRYVVVTATTIKPEKVTTPKVGAAGSIGREDPGIYVAPKTRGSPYFTGITGETSKEYKLTLNPFKVYGKGAKPAVIEIEVAGIEKYPREIVKEPGFARVGEFLKSEKKPGIAYISKRSEIGQGELVPQKFVRTKVAEETMFRKKVIDVKPFVDTEKGTKEIEAIVFEELRRKPIKNTISRLKGYEKYTTLYGENLPVYRYSVSSLVGPMKKGEGIISKTKQKILKGQIASATERAEYLKKGVEVKYVSPYQAVSPVSYVASKLKPEKIVDIKDYQTSYIRSNKPSLSISYKKPESRYYNLPIVSSVGSYIKSAGSSLISTSRAVSKEYSKPKELSVGKSEIVSRPKPVSYYPKRTEYQRYSTTRYSEKIRTKLPRGELSKSTKQIFKPTSRGEGGIAYVPEVRRKGKFFAVGGPTTKGRALLLGATRVKETLAATFRIKPVKVRVALKEQEISYAPSKEVFRRPKSLKESQFTFVQKTGIAEGGISTGRLTTIGEKTEIKASRQRFLR